MKGDVVACSAQDSQGTMSKQTYSNVLVVVLEQASYQQTTMRMPAHFLFGVCVLIRQSLLYQDRHLLFYDAVLTLICAIYGPQRVCF